MNTADDGSNNTVRKRLHFDFQHFCYDTFIRRQQILIFSLTREKVSSNNNDEKRFSFKEINQLFFSNTYVTKCIKKKKICNIQLSWTKKY